jgi:hypothetical protein
MTDIFQMPPEQGPSDPPDEPSGPVWVPRPA